MIDDVDVYVRNRIRQLRDLKGVSARDMSLSLGQNHSYINHLENGKFTPSIEILNYVCDYFTISLSDFFDVTNANPDLVNQLCVESKKLDRTSLQNILDIVKVIHR